MNARRRLLFLSPVVPAPRGNGLAMRTYFFLQAYARCFEVDLAVLPIISAPEKLTEFVGARVKRLHVFPRPPTDSHFSLIAATADPVARLAAFVRYARPSLTSRTGGAAQQMLQEWVQAERYDVVHVERLYLVGLVEPWAAATPASRPRLIIDCDDDDAMAYRRLAELARGEDRTDAARWAEAEAAAFTALAQRALGQFDLAFAASARDAAALSAHGIPVAVIPNVAAMARSPAPRRTKNSRRTVVFVGTMGYSPNDDAARWLLRRIWPRLRRLLRAPLQLKIVGSNPSAELLRHTRRPDVVVTGRVRDTVPFYRAADLAVIPLRAGSGTRIKLLEAAAHGVPIVSTTLGAEGTTFRHGHELLLADTEEKFALACANLLRDRFRGARLARQARKRITLDYDAKRWSRYVGDLVAGTANQVGE